VAEAVRILQVCSGRVRRIQRRGAVGSPRSAWS